MPKILIILIVHVVLLLFCMSRSKSVLLTPQFCFVVGWIPALIILMQYVDVWQVDLGNKTSNILIWSPILFVAICVIWMRFNYSHRHVRIVFMGKNIFEENNSCDYITVNYITAMLGMVAQLFFLAIVLLYIVSVTGANSLVNSFSSLRDMTATSSDFDFPTIISIPRSICLASGYVWFYIFANNIIYKAPKKNMPFYIISIVATCIMNVSMGARGDLIQFIYSCFIIYYFLSMQSKGWSKGSNIRFVLLIIVGVVVGLSTFSQLGNLIGRSETNSFDPLYYAAIYLSAPIVNLDMNLKSGMYDNFQRSVASNASFHKILTYFGQKYNIPQWIADASSKTNEHHWVAGKYIGNVPTTYAYFYHDGGIFGVVILTALMALISIIVYKMAMSRLKECQHSGISIALIVYSQLCFGLTFSFFANEFYLNVFYIAFFRNIIYMWLIKIFLTKVVV